MISLQPDITSLRLRYFMQVFECSMPVIFTVITSRGFGQNQSPTMQTRRGLFKSIFLFAFFACFSSLFVTSRGFWTSPESHGPGSECGLKQDEEEQHKGNGRERKIKMFQGLPKSLHWFWELEKDQEIFPYQFAKGRGAKRKTSHPRA